VKQILGALLLILLSGCTTTLAGARDDPKTLKDVPAGDDKRKMAGVPFRMPAPSFVVTEKPATEELPTRYELTLTHRPSDDQVYLLNIDAPGLTTTEFGLEFGATGQLTSVNANATPGIVPVVNALGEFVVGLVGAAARVSGLGMMDVSDTAPLIATLEKVKTANSNLKALADQVKARLRPGLDAAANTQRLYPQTKAEEGVFEEASKILRREARTSYVNEVNAYLGKASGADNVVAGKDIQNLQNAIERLDEAAVRSLKPGFQGADNEWKALQAKALASMPQWRLAKTFEDAKSLPAREWRHRHATVLEDRIDDIDKQLSVAPTKALEEATAPAVGDGDWRIKRVRTCRGSGRAVGALPHGGHRPAWSGIDAAANDGVRARSTGTGPA
jgi:hypothetical protein